MNPKAERALETLKTLFGDIKNADWSRIGDAYSDDALFIDPVHKLEGLPAIAAYFAALNKNVLEGGFVFNEEDVCDNKVFLTWDMKVRLRRPNKWVTLVGISVLRFDDKVVSHRDYFDMGELVYEHVPVLSTLIRSIKKQMAKT